MKENRCWVTSRFRIAAKERRIRDDCRGESLPQWDSQSFGRWNFYGLRSWIVRLSFVRARNK
jgi:hypothetical protein